MKGAHESQQENSKAEQGAWKERTLDGLLMIHAFAAHSDQQLGEFTSSNLQDLNMRIQGVRTSQQVVWRMPSGVQG